MSPRPRIELLGLPRLVMPQGKPHLLERRDAALLAWLALQGPTPRGRIVSLLWPDVATRAAQTNLRQRLFRLKQHGGSEIVVSEPVLALAPGVDHDLTSTLALDDATTLGTHRLLGSLEYDDCGELGDWVAMSRERLQAQRRERLADRAARLEAEGHIAEALVFAEWLASDAVTAEHAHRRVMRLHYRRGDRAAALAAFERCCKLLRAELGTQPCAETLQLAATIERSSPGPALLAAPTPIPVTILRPPLLVGRESHWVAIETAWQQCKPVLVSGEPGVGKSRLINDFAQRQGGASVVGARPGDAGVPYALLARLLHRLIHEFGAPPPAWIRDELACLVPELGAALPGQVQTLRLWQAVDAALGEYALRGLRALVIDDLQFSDAATLDWLLHHAGRRGEGGTLLLLAVRSEEHPEALARLLAQQPGALIEVQLGPMNEPSVVSFLDSLDLPGLDATAWAAPLLASCGGFPFYLLDAITALHAQGQRDFSCAPAVAPPSAKRESAVLRRLDLLGADAQQLARVAAAAGQDFDVALAADVLACAPVALTSSWKALERAGLFGGSGFAHDLARQSIYDALPLAMARALHRQIAAWLQRSGPTRVASSAARIAGHWQAAQEWAQAAPGFERAAAEAAARSARREGWMAWRTAADCHRKVGLPASQAPAFECEWRALRLLPGLDSLDLALLHANTLVDSATDDRQRAAGLVARAHVHAERYEAEAALVDAREAATLASGVHDTRLELLATQQAAMALVKLARPEETVLMLNVRVDALHHLEDDERMAWLGDQATALDYADRRIEALQTFDRAIAEAEHLDRWELANISCNNKANALLYLNRLPGSTQAIRHAIECGRRAGFGASGMLIEEMMLAGNLRDMGQFAEYLERAEPLPQSMRAAGHAVWAGNAENDLAIAYAWLGRPELAHRTLTALPADTPDPMRAARLFTQARLLRGRPIQPGVDGPAELVRQAHKLLTAAGGAGRSYVRLKVALELARDEEPTLGAQQAAAIESEAVQREQFMLAAHALVLHTELLRRCGDTSAAATAAARLVRRCEQEGDPAGMYAPEAWWVACRALMPTDPTAAEAALRHALAWIEHAAAHQVPEVFRDSFLNRNPVNLAVRSAASRVR